MKLVKLRKVEIRKPYFDPNPNKTKTNNWEWRQGLFMIFVDTNDDEYIYMPTWKDVDMINKSRQIVEQINKEIYQNVQKLKGGKKNGT